MAEIDPRSPKVYTSRLLRRTWLSEETFECELEKPAGFSFLPGQSIRLLWEGMERDYSPVSGPREHSIMLCVRRFVGGAVSQALAGAEPGTPLAFSGPRGFFIYQSRARPPVFVATGTGVAPFVSMARTGARGFLMLHGVRTAAELHYEADLRGAAARYVPCLSGVGERPPDGTFAGRVTEFLRRDLPAGGYDFYLCGRREMIRDATLVADERFPGSMVFTEIFF